MPQNVPQNPLFYQQQWSQNPKKHQKRNKNRAVVVTKT